MRPEAYGVFWIRREDYPRLLEHCVDRATLPPTYEDWLATATEKFQCHERSGRKLFRVIVNLDEFLAWCHIQRRVVDSKARAVYAAYVAATTSGQGHEGKH